MKKIILIALLFLVRFTVFSQTTWDIQEINPSIEQSPFLSPTEIINSWDGAYIKPNLNLRMLNILINIIYDVTPDKDPYKNVPDSLIQWPHAVQEGINNEDTKPEWLEDLFDIEEEEEGNIHGMFTKKYYESSFGNLHLTGDFIVVDIRQSYIIAELQVQDGTFSADNLIKRTIKY